MSSYFLNFTTFDVQLWPPPRRTDPKLFAGYTLNPTLFVPLLLLYHSILSVVLQTGNPQDYQGRRDTLWYRFCLGHMLVLECFCIQFLFAYQKQCSLSDNIGLCLYAIAATLVQVAIS